MIEIKTYDKKYNDFRTLFCDLIKVKSLEMLHKLGGFENVGDKPGSDNNSMWHEKFYANMRGSYFIDCYNHFMVYKIRPQFSESIVCQKFPTLRIQIPNGKGVAAYHVDVDYAHPIEEINIWLPITDAKDTATIQIESEPGKKDYKPQNLVYGQYLMFEGGRLSHGNEVNKTGKTRVSIDMRIIPFSKYTPSDMKGIHFGKVRTTEGENAYYKIIK